LDEAGGNDTRRDGGTAAAAVRRRSRLRPWASSKHFETINFEEIIFSFFLVKLQREARKKGQGFCEVVFYLLKQSDFAFHLK